MSIITPLTASSDIQRSLAPKATDTAKEKPIKPNFGEFSHDLVEISKLGIEKQQQESALNTSKEIENIAHDVIRVSSTIGQAQSSGKLSRSQATDLYNKISSLL